MARLCYMCWLFVTNKDSMADAPVKHDVGRKCVKHGVSWPILDPLPSCRVGARNICIYLCCHRNIQQLIPYEHYFHGHPANANKPKSVPEQIRELTHGALQRVYTNLICYGRRQKYRSIHEQTKHRPARYLLPQRRCTMMVRPHCSERAPLASVQ